MPCEISCSGSCPALAESVIKKMPDAPRNAYEHSLSLSAEIACGWFRRQQCRSTTLIRELMSFKSPTTTAMPCRDKAMAVSEAMFRVIALISHHPSFSKACTQPPPCCPVAPRTTTTGRLTSCRLGCISKRALIVQKQFTTLLHIYSHL